MSKTTIPYHEALEDVRHHWYLLGLPAEFGVLDKNEIIDFATKTLGKYVDDKAISFLNDTQYKLNILKCNELMEEYQIKTDWIEQLYTLIDISTSSDGKELGCYSAELRKKVESLFSQTTNKKLIKSACVTFERYTKKLNDEKHTKNSEKANQKVVEILERLERLGKEKISDTIILDLIKLFQHFLFQHIPGGKQYQNQNKDLLDNVRKAYDHCRHLTIHKNYINPYIEKCREIICNWQKEYSEYKIQNNFLDPNDIRCQYISLNHLKKDEITIKETNNPINENFLEYREIQLILSVLKYISVFNKQEDCERILPLLKYEILHLTKDIGTVDLILGRQGESSNFPDDDYFKKIFKKNLVNMIEYIIDTFHIITLCKKWKNQETRCANIERLKKQAGTFCSKATNKGLISIDDFLSFLYQSKFKRPF